MTSQLRRPHRSSHSDGAAGPSARGASRPRRTFSRRTALCVVLLLLLSPTLPSSSSSHLVSAAHQVSPRAPAKAEPISDPRWGSGWAPGLSYNDEVHADEAEDEFPLAPAEGGDAPGTGAGFEADGAPKKPRPPKGAFAGDVEAVADIDAPPVEDGVGAVAASAKVEAGASSKPDRVPPSQASPRVKELPWTIGGMRHYDEPPGSGGARPTRGWTGKWPPWDKWEVIDEMRKAAYFAAGGDPKSAAEQQDGKANTGVLSALFGTGAKGGEFKAKKQIEEIGDSMALLKGDGASGGSSTMMAPGAKGNARHGDGSRWACRSTGACVACARDQPFPASCHPYGRHRPVECFQLQSKSGAPVGGVAGAPPVLAGGRKGWRRSTTLGRLSSPVRARADAKKDDKAAAAVQAAQEEQQQQQQVTGWDGERVSLSGWESCGRSKEEAGWGFAQFVSLNLLLALGALWLLISRQKVMSSRWRGIVERRIGRRA